MGVIVPAGAGGRTSVEGYDPKLHDSIMGPVEEFITGTSSVGYDEARSGGTFIRIGVGVVKKPEEKQEDKK